MNGCLVNEDEWKEMLKTNLTQEFENDPFETYMKRYEQED